ncbi:oligosaccharide flippase family protein [Xinfangfangia pollutisoli]|uniref:oligosaccharide flippase family protein n=1 Tax=Xinfangfangia pollutisoli TaxID=2865960 RepID=UPI001CD69D10|nr:oligosaccharide flippase family protein [Xinfangfangia pollutisoli]
MAQGGLHRRALSGGALTAGSYAVTQALRLGSNLVLTRLLFPEAFGVMALVSVVLVGLAMFSDTGIGPAISRSPRGDAPDFLDTAWTINVLRGALLWLLTCACAWPVARLYGAPELAALLPAAGLTLLIAGFNPTRIDTANRHLLLGRLTALDLLAQVIGIAAMVVLAWTMRSVWALVLGALIGSAAKLVLCWAFLPGPANRFRWDSSAAAELVQFGKWIFLSTACGFLLSQGDKAILGAYLNLADLGIYNIGYFLASFPMLLAGQVVARIMIPLYRDHPPAASAQNARRLSRLRFGLSLSVLALLTVMALAGGPVVRLLYDDRYLAAGVLVTAIAMAQMPGVIGMTYDQSALAAGDGRGYFLLIAAKAGLQTLAFLAGAELAGLGGALLGQGIALALVHPLIARLAWRHRAWDMRHDLALGALTLLLLAALGLLYRQDLATLTP